MLVLRQGTFLIKRQLLAQSRLQPYFADLVDHKGRILHGNPDKLFVFESFPDCFLPHGVVLFFEEFADYAKDSFLVIGKFYTNMQSTLFTVSLLMLHSDLAFHFVQICEQF